MPMLMGLSVQGCATERGLSLNSKSLGPSWREKEWEGGRESGRERKRGGGEGERRGGRGEGKKQYKHSMSLKDTLESGLFL